VLLCQPALVARREVAKGIADRIQKLADEISAYKFPRQGGSAGGDPVTPTRQQKYKQEIAHGDASPVQSPVQSPVRIAARQHQPPKSEPRPSRRIAAAMATDFDPKLQREIEEYMATPSDGDVVIGGRVDVSSKPVRQSVIVSSRHDGRAVAMPPSAVAAAREKLAGRTAAFKRQQVAEKVRTWFCVDVVSLWDGKQ
jgi:hypothetical protein